MIQKKICMLGGFSVGKTSLVGRYVKSTFSDKYHTTVGAKVDKKVMRVGSTDMTLMVWDIQGEDGVQPLRPAYLRGSAGYVIVVDSTRAPTLTVAQQVQAKVQELLGPVPFVVMLNKSDMTEEQQLNPADIRRLAQHGWFIFSTSAKTGQNVEEAFTALAQKMLEATANA